MKTIERSEMMKEYILYDTHYKKIKKDGEHWYEIHFIPRGTIPAPNPETALEAAKKQGHPLPVIGPADRVWVSDEAWNAGTKPTSARQAHNA